MALGDGLPIPEAPNPGQDVEPSSPPVLPRVVLVLPAVPTAPARPGLRFPITGNAVLVIDSSGISINVEIFKLR